MLEEVKTQRSVTGRDANVTICSIDQPEPRYIGQVASASRSDMSIRLDHPLQLAEAVYVAVQSVVMLAEVRYCRPVPDGFVVGLELVTRLGEEDVSDLITANPANAEPVPEEASTPEALLAETAPASDTLFEDLALAPEEQARPSTRENAPSPTAGSEREDAVRTLPPEWITLRLTEALEGLRAVLDAMPERKVFLTLREAAAYSGLPQSHLRSLHRSGQLEFTETGAGYRIRRTDLEKL